ncbi:MAG TPA: serine hydrolase domain-containing protein, partial [Victivallales bacterium]|nr:serine hydrolase domain-containing protein [Victivallales bacterium]
MKIIITIFAIFSIISFSAFAKENNHNIQADTNVTEIINYLKNNIPKYLKENDIAGASAVIVSKKGEIWAQGFGHLSKDSKVAVTPETIFCVGSISKIFTTTGILIAAQNGTIDINKPIKYYLPNFKINSVFSKSPADKITILDLLSFRAGLADKIQNAKNSPLLKQDIQDIEKTWIRFPLGQRFAYSEPTYDLAGYILAKKEKISFSKSMEKLVFNPLGMNSTTFSIKKIKADKNRATGYIPKINKIYLTVRPSGSAYSNAVDIGKFISFQLNNGSINGKQLLSKNNIKLMRTVPDKTNYQRTGFGLPVISVNTGNGIVYSY